MWVVLAILLPVALLCLSRLGQPSDGTVSPPSRVLWGEGVLVQDIDGPAGELRVDDLVVTVDGVPLREWVEHPRTEPLAAGQTHHYGVIRDEVGALVEIPVVLHDYDLRARLLAHIALLPFAVTLFVVAAFAYLRRPDDHAARAIFRTAAFLWLSLPANPFGMPVIDVVTGRLWPQLVGDLFALLMWAAILEFALLFPGLPGPFARHPRAITVAAYLAPVLAYLGNLAVMLPRTSDPLKRLGLLVSLSGPAADFVPYAVIVVMLAGFLLASDQVVRQRLTLVFASLAFGFAGLIFLGRMPEWILGRPIISDDWLTLPFIPFPLAIGVAVLRCRLFDLRAFTGRWLANITAAIILVIVYLGAAALAGLALGTPVDIGPLAAGAAGVLSVLWLRGPLNRLVARRVLGDRDEPDVVVRRLGQSIEASTTPQAVLGTVVETLARTLRLPFVRLEMAGPGGHIASHGSPSGEPVVVPLVHRGEQVGRLVLDTGPSAEPFGSGDRKLLDAVARQVSASVHDLLLTDRLQRSLERVVLAREEERRRLRRDIHDGLGPMLASARMRAELARDLLRDDPAAAGAVLDTLAQIHGQALSDLRRLVDGLRPPALDQLGLVGAVRELADGLTHQHNLVLTLDVADPLPPLPAAVEVAAYRIAAEALTNIVKHAQASSGVVRLWCDDDRPGERPARLVLQVRDDGVGLHDDYRAGTGLLSIVERATELGGHAVIEPVPGGATLVHARLPLLDRGPAQTG